MKYFDEEYGSDAFYYKNCYGKIQGLAAGKVFNFLGSYPHRLMEKPHKTNANKRILEVGFGAGEHYRFVGQDFSKYVGLDIREYPKDVYPVTPLFQFFKGDASSLPFPDKSFDRIIATCLVAHLVEVEKALLEWKRVVTDNGAVTVYLPAEPSLALRLFRKLLSERQARKLGFQGHKLLCAREHIHSYNNLRVFIEEIFADCDYNITMRPFPKLGWYLNLFAIVQIRVKK